MTPAEQAQKQAEQAMDGFMAWSKKGLMWSAIFLCVVVFACNNGVETGANKTGSQYNGEQYSPMNMGK
jgi:hypothetical protein